MLTVTLAKFDQYEKGYNLTTKYELKQKQTLNGTQHDRGTLSLTNMGVGTARTLWMHGCKLQKSSHSRLSRGGGVGSGIGRERPTLPFLANALLSPKYQ